MALLVKCEALGTTCWQPWIRCEYSNETGTTMFFFLCVTLIFHYDEPDAGLNWWSVLVMGQSPWRNNIASHRSHSDLWSHWFFKWHSIRNVIARSGRRCCFGICRVTAWFVRMDGCFLTPPRLDGWASHGHPMDFLPWTSRCHGWPTRPKRRAPGNQRNFRWNRRLLWFKIELESDFYMSSEVWSNGPLCNPASTYYIQYVIMHLRFSLIFFDHPIHDWSKSSGCLIRLDCATLKHP